MSLWVALASVTAQVAPATERRLALDLPAGPLGSATERLAHEAGINIVLADAALWDRRVPRLRGRLKPEEAVRALARHAGVEVRRLGATTWRLSQRPARRRRTVSIAPTTSAPSSDPEIVILASKRGTPERRMAGSIEYIAAPRIGIDAGTQVLVSQSTAISTTYRGAGREKLFVRGIADSSFAGQLQSVTGVYLGEVRLGYSATDPDLQIHDIATVEVLPGPQGTLYGAGSLSGIIRLNPVMPRRDAVEGTVGIGTSYTVRGKPGTDIDAMANLPLSGSAAMRVVGYARQDGGFIDKPAIGADRNRTRTAGARAAIRWWTAPDWTVDAIAMMQGIRGRDSQYASADAPPLTSLNAIPEPFESRYAAGHVVVHGKLGEAELTSASGVAGQTLDERFNALDGMNVGAIVDLGRRHRLLTHESRVSREAGDGSGWVAGIALTDSHATLRRRYTGPSPELLESVGNRVTELALFGEGTVPVTSFLSLGGGARIVQLWSSARLLATSLPDGVDGRAPHRVERWLLPTGSATLFPSRALSAFLRYQEGRRPGALVAGQGELRARVPGDRMRMAEAGLRWNGGRGALAALSVSRTRWLGIQADYLEDGSGLFTGTLGDGTIRSVTLSFDWPVGAEVRIEGAATLNDGRIDPPQLAVAAAYPAGGASMVPEPSRPRIPAVADVIARIGARWSRRIGAAALVRIEGWARYEGTSVAAIGPVQVGRHGDYLATGLTAGLRRGRDEVTLAFDNLLDARATRFLLGSAVFAGSDRPTPLRPWTARIALRRTF